MASPLIGQSLLTCPHFRSYYITCKDTAMLGDDGRGYGVVMRGVRVVCEELTRE